MNHLGIISQPHCAIGWDSKACDLAPRESRAGKWLLAGLLQFGTSGPSLLARKLLARECFTPGRGC